MFWPTELTRSEQGRDRTTDNPVNGRMLYQLSYLSKDVYILRRIGHNPSSMAALSSSALSSLQHLTCPHRKPLAQAEGFSPTSSAAISSSCPSSGSVVRRHLPPTFALLCTYFHFRTRFGDASKIFSCLEDLQLPRQRPSPQLAVLALGLTSLVRRHRVERLPRGEVPTVGIALQRDQPQPHVSDGQGQLPHLKPKVLDRHVTGT